MLETDFELAARVAVEELRSCADVMLCLGYRASHQALEMTMMPRASALRNVGP
jgi:hypothetical protein